MTTTYLYEEKDLFSIAHIIQSSNLLHCYFLWRLIRAKKAQLTVCMHQSLREYLENTIPTDENGKNIIKKYLLQ